MPVFSRSAVSMARIVPSPPFIISRKRSASALAPGRISLPSRTVMGGSSTKVASIRSAQSSNASIDSSKRFNRGESICCSCCLTAGNALKPFARPSNSRPLTEPVTMRVITRSRSVTCFRASCSSPRQMVEFTSSSTAFKRRWIWLGSSKGFSSQLRIRRPPMGVLVLSNTQRRVPFFSLLRRVSVSSRFRLASRSNSMNLPVV